MQLSCQFVAVIGERSHPGTRRSPAGWITPLAKVVAAGHTVRQRGHRCIRRVQLVLLESGQRPLEPPLAMHVGTAERQPSGEQVGELSHCFSGYLPGCVTPTARK